MTADTVQPAPHIGQRPSITARPVANEFELRYDQGRLGLALVFAFLAGMGLLLALFATPTPVIIAGWGLVAGGGPLAFRQLVRGAPR